MKVALVWMVDAIPPNRWIQSFLDAATEFVAMGSSAAVGDGAVSMLGQVGALKRFCK